MVLVSRSRVPSTAPLQLGLCRIRGKCPNPLYLLPGTLTPYVTPVKSCSLSHRHAQPSLLSANYFTI